MCQSDCVAVDSKKGNVPTRYSTTGSASTQVVDDSCVTLNNAVHVQVAPEASIGDLLVLEAPYGCFDSLGSGCTCFEITNSDPGSSVWCGQY